MNPPGLSLLTFNIGNPSPERARRQLAWLASRDEQVLVLTETKASAGCTSGRDHFQVSSASRISRTGSLPPAGAGRGIGG